MVSYSNYKSHEEGFMKEENEETIKYFDPFDPQITIKEDWEKDENKTFNESDKNSANWSDFYNDRYKPYKCTKCTKAFEFNKDLLLHIQQSHEDFRPFECEYCNHSFYQEVELFFHTCNFLSSLHQCSMCYISFESLKALKSHSKVHKKRKKKKIYPRKDIAIVHESKEHNIKKPPIKKIRLAYEEINCPDKDFENLEIPYLTKDNHDIDEIEIIPVNNKKEHKVQKLKKMITVHMKSVHEQKESYECMICSEKFAKETQLSKHTCKPYVPELSLIDCPVSSNNEQIFPDVEEVHLSHLTKDTHEIDEFDLIPMSIKKETYKEKAQT